MSGSGSADLRTAGRLGPCQRLGHLLLHAGLPGVQRRAAAADDCLRSCGGILAESGEDTAEQLRRGNEALYRATLGKTRLAYVPDAEEAELQALEEVGWRCLTPSMDRADYKLESSSNASALMKRVSARRGDVSVWLGTTASAAGLREFVISAQGAGHYCRAMTEIG